MFDADQTLPDADAQKGDDVTGKDGNGRWTVMTYGQTEVSAG